MTSSCSNVCCRAASASRAPTVDVDQSNPELVVRWEIVDNITPANTKTITVLSEAVRQALGAPKQFTASALRAR